MEPISKNDLTGLKYIAVEGFVQQIHIDELYEILSADDFIERIRAIFEMPEASEEHILQLNDMLWSAYERKIGRV